MSSNEDEILSQFISISQCPSDEARRYLEVANWDLDMAMECFYDNGGPQAGQPLASTIPPVGGPGASTQNTSGAPSSAPLQPTISTGGTGGYESDDEGAMQSAIEDSLRSKPEVHHAASSATTKKEEKKKTKTTPSKFGTISSLQKSDNSSDEEGQAFYAGGSERSGQQIIGPPKSKENNDKKVTQLFEAARQQGAQEADTHECDDEECGHDGGGRKKKHNVFGGLGHTLGDDTTPSRTLGTAATTAPSAAGGRAEQLPLRFYSDGFTVGDGELRKFDDPANKDFMDHIKRSEIPPELKAMATGGKQVEVRLEDHRNEEYRRMTPAFKPFTGHGHMLGTPTPNVTVSSTTTTSAPVKSAMTGSSSSAPSSVQSTDVARLQKLAEQRFASASSSQATQTTIRLRMPDAAAPIAISIPLDRTLADIRQLLNEAWPSLANNANFEFIEPPQTKIGRDDERKSLRDAKLNNALLAVRRL